MIGGLLVGLVVMVSAGDERHVVGALVEADFLHRSGQVRVSGGALVDFTLTPAAPVLYLGTEGDLRDVPLGASCVVTLGAGRSTECLRLVVDSPTTEAATAAQARRHGEFLRRRGLAASIVRVEGRRMAVELLGDPSSIDALLRREQIDPARWAAERRVVHVAVANEELRTYNPHVDGQRSTVLGFERVPTDNYGRAGIRWVIEPPLMLEGFRLGRFVRIFAHPSWPIADMPFGDSLYTELPNLKPELREPLHYPYRTDFANEHLPWYRPQTGVFPPAESHHRVVGELLAVDAGGRSGRLRADVGGEIVAFTMPSYGWVLRAGAEAELGDIALGTRVSVLMHPDDGGAFTRATAVVDEASSMAGELLSERLDEIHLDAGSLRVGRRHAPVKDDKEDLVQPPDLGRRELAVDARTRVWKGEAQVKLDALAVGDDLRVNTSGRTPWSRGMCVDIWAGPEAIKRGARLQQARVDERRLRDGVIGRVEAVDGKRLTLALFAGGRRAHRDFLDAHKGAGRLIVTRVDEGLNPLGEPSIYRHVDERFEGTNAASMGFSGTRWWVEGDRPADILRPGTLVRIVRDGWH